MTATPCSREIRSYVRHDPSASVETSIPDAPRPRCSSRFTSRLEHPRDGVGDGALPLEPGEVPTARDELDGRFRHECRRLGRAAHRQRVVLAVHEECGHPHGREPVSKRAPLEVLLHRCERLLGALDAVAGEVVAPSDARVGEVVRPEQVVALKRRAARAPARSRPCPRCERQAPRRAPIPPRTSAPGSSA